MTREHSNSAGTQLKTAAVAPDEVSTLLTPGDHSEEVPPVPIPNTEVKLFSADGTAIAGE